MIHSGIPEAHKLFWRELGVDGISRLYTSLTVTTKKVLEKIKCDCMNCAEKRVFGYLITMIGNMGVNDVRNFLRFTTGSSVCVAKSITVCFNAISGLGRRPFANTCTYNLQLPVSYLNYHDFFSEWSAILSDTDNEWKWCMDGY